MSMRICLVSREYPPDTGWGGIGTFMYHLAHGLAQLGHDVHVIALEGTLRSSHMPATSGPEPTVHRVPPYRTCPSNGLFNYCLPVTRPMLDETVALWHKFLTLHKEKPFDVVETPEHFAEGLFLSLARVAPLVIRLHTPHSKLVKERFHNFEPSFDHRILTGLERVAMLTADTLVSPSEDLAGYVANDLNLPLERIHIVRNPVDINKFTVDGKKVISDPTATTILFVGRVEGRKGIHFLIDAMPKVVKVCPQARLIVIGSDTNTGAGHKSVTTELKEKLAEHGCQNAVQFIQHIPLSEMPDFYRSADICVLPSLYDNAPMTAIEAMSSGKPVVVSSAGGAKEYVLDGQCGLVVPPANAEALADALIKLVQDQELRTTMGDNARKRALAQFSIQKTCADTLSVYDEARDAFAKKNQPALYPGAAEHLQEDLTSLIGTLEKRLYEMMYTHSWRFRLKHWQKRAHKILTRS